VYLYLYFVKHKLKEALNGQRFQSNCIIHNCSPSIQDYSIIWYFEINENSSLVVYSIADKQELWVSKSTSNKLRKTDIKYAIESQYWLSLDGSYVRILMDKSYPIRDRYKPLWAESKLTDGTFDVSRGVRETPYYLAERTLEIELKTVETWILDLESATNHQILNPMFPSKI